MFSKELNKKLDKYHLLNHPFYKSWNDGKLTREIIKDYAEQYYQHVKAFPRYISATHSLCEDIEKRKILLENLQDEENRDGDHPKHEDFTFASGAQFRIICYDVHEGYERRQDSMIITLNSKEFTKFLFKHHASK